MTLKAKYADFQQITRSRTGQAPITTQAAVEEIVYALLESLFPVKQGHPAARGDAVVAR